MYELAQKNSGNSEEALGGTDCRHRYDEVKPEYRVESERSGGPSEGR